MYVKIYNFYFNVNHLIIELNNHTSPIDITVSFKCGDNSNPSPIYIALMFTVTNILCVIMC